MAGLPQAWVALEEAITYHAKQMVAWSLGREVREFRGGWQKQRRALADRHQVDPRDQGHRRRVAHPRAEPHQLDAVRARPPALRLLRQALPDPRPLARPRRAGVARRPRLVDQYRDRVPQLQHAQGRPLARAGAHAAALRAVRAQPPRALHPAQPAHPRRPDGIPAGRRAAHEPAARAQGGGRPGCAPLSFSASGCETFDDRHASERGVDRWRTVFVGAFPLARRGLRTCWLHALDAVASCGQMCWRSRSALALAPAGARAGQDQGRGDLHGAGRAAVGVPHPQGAERRRGARRDRVHVLRERRQRRLRARDAPVRRAGQHVHRRRVVRRRGGGAQGRQGLSEGRRS